MHESLKDLIVCPSCHGDLQWEVSDQSRREIREGCGTCLSCRSSFEVRNGIAAFLVPPASAPAEDLWEEADSQIASFVRSEPESTQKLMEAPLESLNPTDQLVRMLVLEERGNFREALKVREVCLLGMYGLERLAAAFDQMKLVRGRLARRRGPVVDLASGMGYLLEFLAPRSSRLWVATDLSPRVLRRDQRAFAESGAQMSFLAFDARRTPFRDGSLSTLVTNLGLSNIGNPGDLLKELRRILGGEFLSIMTFWPEDDGGPNADAIREMGLGPLLYRRQALQGLEDAGFSVEVLGSRKVEAHPTPEGEIMKGLRPDRLPVVDSEIEFCTVVARPHNSR